MNNILHFLNYLRYRSFGLITLLITLIITTNNMIYLLLLILFILHTYFIYKQEDKGITHYLIIKKIQEFEAQHNANQNQIVNLIKEINQKI